MKYLKFVFLFLVVTQITCGKGGETIDKIKSLAEEGKQYLSEGNFQSAETKFDEILKLDPNNCDGIYGMMLSKLMKFLNQVLGEASSIGGLIPQTNEIDTIAESVLKTILEGKGNLLEIESYVALAEAKNCSFELVKLPIAFAGIEIRGEWDIHEAHLIGLVLDAIEGIIEFLLAYDLSVQTGPLISAISDNSLKLSLDDITGTLRGLGLIFDTSPDFLKWHPLPERRNYFDASAGDFSSFFRRLNGVLDVFTEQDKNPQDDIIAWVDSDGDGTVSSGDSILINAYDMETGGQIIDLSQYSSLLLPVVNSMLPDWKTKLQRCEDAFAFRLQPGERISLNDLLLGFGTLLGIPNIFEFDILAFYKGADYSGTAVKPLRELIPYLYDHDNNAGTSRVLLVEGESFSLPPQGTESYLFQGDSIHFNIGFDWNVDDPSTDPVTGEIKKDCAISPEKGFEIGTDANGVPIYLPLLYFGFTEPSFNGAIYVDSGGSCGDSSGFVRANVYSLNKALNRIIASLSTLLSGGPGGLPF